MSEKIFVFFIVLIFLYLLYQQFRFQKAMFFSSIEPFTPQEVENIIQPPGSNTIGTINSTTAGITMLQTVSNGYTQEVINNLKPSNPSAFDRQETDSMGSFPDVEQEKYPLPTTEFEYPNKYKFTVEYPCRKSATGMYTDCGVWSANDAWTADPYKGLNCPLANTTTPKQADTISRSREIKYA